MSRPCTVMSATTKGCQVNAAGLGRRQLSVPGETCRGVGCAGTRPSLSQGGGGPARGPDGTNKATVTLDDPTQAPFTGTAPVTFGAPSSLVDATITVVDDKTNPGSPATLGTATYTDPSPKELHLLAEQARRPGTCTDYKNIATFTTNDTATTGSDYQTVTVCVGKDLTVTKTATPTFTRTFRWTIDKSVDQTKIDIAQGGTATFNYTVAVSHDSGTDSGWATSGSIIVSNPNDWEAITFDLADTSTAAAPARSPVAAAPSASPRATR